MKPRAVDFVSYSVTDMARSEAFYRDVLGLDVEVPRGEPGTRSAGFMEFDAGGTSISLTALSPHPNAIVALAVEDVGAAVEELRGKGRADRDGAARDPRLLHGGRGGPGRQPDPDPPAEGRVVRLEPAS